MIPDMENKDIDLNLLQDQKEEDIKDKMIIIGINNIVIIKKIEVDQEINK
jgi:hypothetical protein